MSGELGWGSYGQRNVLGFRAGKGVGVAVFGGLLRRGDADEGLCRVTLLLRLFGKSQRRYTTLLLTRDACQVRP